MKSYVLALFTAAALALGAGVAYAAGLGSGGLMGGQQGQGQVLAQGPGGALTADAVNAYIEALEFCLGQVGSPQQFSAQERQQMTQILAQGFATLPVETQQALATARPTWTQYQQAWPQLGLEQKKAFAYDVLALAYGDQAAAEALGMGGGYGGGYGGGGSDDLGGGEAMGICVDCNYNPNFGDPEYDLEISYE